MKLAVTVLKCGGVATGAAALTRLWAGERAFTFPRCAAAVRFATTERWPKHHPAIDLLATAARRLARDLVSESPAKR